jgi:hypothetical protein
MFSFLSVLQYCDISIFQTLEEFPFEAEKIEKGYNLVEHATGLPKIHGLSSEEDFELYRI